MEWKVYSGERGQILFPKYLIDLSFLKLKENVLNLLEYHETPPSIMIENPNEKLLLKWMRDYEKNLCIIILMN